MHTKNVKKILRVVLLCLAGAVLLVCPAAGQVPGLISYQGRLAVGGTNFTGTGQFKFALVSGNGATVYWFSSPDANADNQPDSSVSLAVNAGLFSVYLGDTNLPGMALLPAWVFTNPAVCLRIWANDGVHGGQRLAPDQPIGAAGYAMMAAAVADGSITPAKLSASAAAQLTASLSSQVAALTAQVQALSAQVSSLTNQGGGTPVAGITLSSTDPADAGFLAQGYQMMATLPSPGWSTSLADGEPSARSRHSGLWTGSSFLVWGGILGDGGETSSGGVYRPDSDAWQAVSTINAPSPRGLHTALWSGQEMLVWGGYGGGAFLKTGGRFKPAVQAWSAMNTSGAPEGRADHVAVWTGSRLVIWGGRSLNGLLGDGGIYDPVADQWSALNLANPPAARKGASAVWTGSGVLIWGGVSELGALGSGALLVFGANGLSANWRAVSQVKAPAGRSGHSAVWTGSKLLVWGGKSGSTLLGDGAAYDPVSDGWSAISAASAPAPRASHAAVWTGREMLVFGGEISSGTAGDGAAYDPAADRWRPLSGLGDPQPRRSSAAAWSGSELLLFGGLANDQPLAGLQRLNPQPDWYLFRKP